MRGWCGGESGMCREHSGIMGLSGNALGDLLREDVWSSRLRSECRLGLVLRLLGCHDMEDRIKLTVVGNPDLIFLIPFRSAEIDEVIQEYGCHHGIAGAEEIGRAHV